ncbi:MAG TPA: hypothetical protein VKF38_09825 [Anaerolineaceae bacterium]|nr:hypothetical protein [Anaerolineaceae bacterium]
MMDEKLRPCPWCGKPAIVRNFGNTVQCSDNECCGHAAMIRIDWQTRPLEDALIEAGNKLHLAIARDMRHTAQDDWDGLDNLVAAMQEWTAALALARGSVK